MTLAALSECKHIGGNVKWFANVIRATIYIDLLFRFIASVRFLFFFFYLFLQFSPLPIRFTIGDELINNRIIEGLI